MNHGQHHVQHIPFLERIRVSPTALCRDAYVDPLSTELFAEDASLESFLRFDVAEGSFSAWRPCTRIGWESPPARYITGRNAASVPCKNVECPWKNDEHDVLLADADMWRIRTNTDVPQRAHAHTHTHTHTHTHSHTLSYTHTHTHSLIHTHTGRQTDRQLDRHTHTHTHTRTHTHTKKHSSRYGCVNVRAAVVDLRPSSVHTATLLLPRPMVQRSL